MPIGAETLRGFTAWPELVTYWVDKGSDIDPSKLQIELEAPYANEPVPIEIK